MKRNILVAHGGGPTTVINASLFGVIDEAMRQSSCLRRIRSSLCCFPIHLLLLLAPADGS